MSVLNTSAGVRLSRTPLLSRPNRDLSRKPSYYLYLHLLTLCVVFTTISVVMREGIGEEGQGVSWQELTDKELDAEKETGKGNFI